MANFYEVLTAAVADITLHGYDSEERVRRWVEELRAAALVISLLSPTPDFLSILTMGFGSARPVEYMSYVPDSAIFRAHTLSDGPYEITSYTAGKSITLDRNPAWSAASDPLRHAYVNKIDITEGLTADTWDRDRAGIVIRREKI